MNMGRTGGARARLWGIVEGGDRIIQWVLRY
jgi:hypothetical protein